MNVDDNRVSKTMYIITDEGKKGTRRSPRTPCTPVPGRRAGRTQTQVMEDQYWEKLRKMEEGGSGPRDPPSNSFSEDVISMRNAHMCMMATLNRNNNGNTKEGKKSKCQERAKPRSRHGYSSKRPTNAIKLCSAEETHHGDLDTNHSESGANKLWSNGLPGSVKTANKQDGNTRFRDHVVRWNHKEPTQGERIVKKANVGGAEGVATTSFSGAADASVQTDLGKKDGPSLERLLWEVSHFKSISDIPKSLQDKLLQKMCKPLLNGGYKDDKTLWSNLFDIPLPQLCKMSSRGFVPRAVTATTIPHPGARTESVTDMKQCNNLSKRSTCRQSPKLCRKEVSSSVHPYSFLCDDDLIEDLCFKGCSSGEGSGTSINSLWDDDFIHDHYILSPSRASLGQAYNSDHGITSLSTLDYDEDKPASHEPFPSEYVFKRACGPSFTMSPDFGHIKIPTLPSDMVDYQLGSDGLTDKVIGTGCSGKVYAATLTLSARQSREIAVKEIFMNIRSRGSIVNETRISLYLAPTGYVPICYGLVKDEKGRYSIVLELFGSGQTLRAIFNTKKSLPKIHWLHIACQLVDGLGKIHDKDVIINDIKPDNILVDLSGTLPKVKYCDMGSASYKTGITFDEGQDMKNFIYIAPEVCTYTQTTKASDVFSLGKVFQNIHSCSQIHTMLVLYNMCSAKTPADRPDLSCLRRMLQEDYTKEVLSQTEEARGYLDPSEQEPEPQGFVIKDSESPGKKASPQAGNVSLGNQASEVESGNTGDNAAPDNHTQGSHSTIRSVSNTESTFANTGVSTAHELSACTQKMPPTDAEFSAIQQTCDGTKDDCSLPTITEEAAAITENQNKPAAAPKTDESQVTRPTSSLVKADQGMFSKANSDHGVSSPIATESAAPLPAHGLSAAKMKEAPANQDCPAPAPSSAFQQAVYQNVIPYEANVFEKLSELTFSDVSYFLGLLIMLAFRILWTTDVDVQ